MFGSDFLMLHKQFTIWFLVAYLGLLLNLGPSLHHAQIFDLHGNDAVATGCCCCSHSHPTVPTDGRSDSLDSDSLDSEHDCSFCKFFDQLHVIVDCYSLQTRSGFVFTRDLNRPTEIYSVLLTPLARGPPAVA